MALPTRPIPPRDDLLRLARAALSNAADLLADARWLAEKGGFPRAHALATLACEELGKEQHCLSAVWRPFMRPKDFWEGFYNHKQKLLHAQGQAALESGPIGPSPLANERIRQEAQSVHRRKLRGLFVDYADDGPQLPCDVTEQETRHLIDRAQAVLDSDEITWVRRVAQVEERARWPLLHRIILILFFDWAVKDDLDVLMRVLRDDGPPAAFEDLSRRFIQHLSESIPHREANLLGLAPLHGEPVGNGPAAAG